MLVGPHPVLCNPNQPVKLSSAEHAVCTREAVGSIPTTGSGVGVTLSANPGHADTLQRFEGGENLPGVVSSLLGRTPN